MTGFMHSREKFVQNGECIDVADGFQRLIKDFLLPSLRDQPVFFEDNYK